MSFHNDAIFWVETDKISPNPYQPRREFDPGKLQDLADSIRQYGVLQPLVVTRKEEIREDGGMKVTYELIAGERRLRASKLANVSQVPVVIRSDEEQENVKLELAIIENLQREDLNPIDRARAFKRLVEEFGHNHGQIGKKVGMSRVYVTNTLRLLKLPEEIKNAIALGRIKEGHSRPLLMLGHRPEEQRTLFKEIVFKKMNVRDAERISRRIAVEKTRSYDPGVRPEVREFEKKVGESLGTRVLVKKNAAGKEGGKVVIDFSSEEGLSNLMNTLEEKLYEIGTREEKEQNEEPPKVQSEAQTKEVNAKPNEEENSIEKYFSL